MDIRFTNSLTRKKEVFIPIHAGKVGMYACGPTVYSTPTIGNFRTFILSDVVRRVLEFNGYEVKHVMNITDVGHLASDGDDGEDKMMKAMRQEGKSAWDIARFYTDEFLRDMRRVNLLEPTVMPRATDHIAEQIEMIQALEKNGFTYQTSDGIYFDTSKLPDYGVLSGQKLEEKEEGARVVANPEKKNASDFALWKLSSVDEQREMEWDSPWGVGFPGWHIECSAMAEKYLDSPFDIHLGGADLAPVHHENEMAQTKGARKNGLANVWIHGAFLLINDGKMSKSLGNAYTIQDLIDKNFDPMAFRFFVFGAHYRSPLNFTWKALEASQNALNKLYDEARTWSEPTEPDAEAVERFRADVNDDLNMPAALAQLWKVVNNETLDSAVKAATVLKFDTVFGLRLDKYVATPLVLPQEVLKLLDERREAREQKDWERSDAVRDQITERGYIVEDTPDGQRIREKHG